MRSPATRALALVVFIQAFALPAIAETGSALNQNRLTPWYLDRDVADRNGSAARKWSLDLGAEIGFEPDYVGSDDREFEIFPALVVHYIASESFRFRATPATLVGVADVTDNTAVQLVFEYEEGRSASETKDLTALSDGADTVEAELTVAHRFGAARRNFIYATYQPEILDRDKGQVWFIGAGRQFQPAPRLLISSVLDLSWGDGEHMMTEFGLTEEQAQLLDQPTYRSSGGLKSSTANLIAQWNPTERITVLANASVEYYFSKAADSPLVDVLGSEVGYEFEVGLIYRF